jgi:ubiquinone biosynthesis protein UbiJ
MNNIADIAIERLLERAVTQARTDSPRAVSLLAALKGRKLSITISGTPWNATVESDGQTLQLRPGGPADASIIGAPLSLLRLAGEQAQDLISSGDVKIEGNAEIAQQFRDLGLLLRPDLEAGLSRLVGRSGAHLAMRGLRAARDWTRAAAWTAAQNVAEYLAHERGDLLSRAEAEHFLRGVDELREHLDRVDARLRQLEQRARALTGEQKP